MAHKCYLLQCTGEAEYVDDMPALPGQLYASFVKSTQANATIQNIDTSAIVVSYKTYEFIR